jgi:hypothetical protein
MAHLDHSRSYIENAPVWPENPQRGKERGEGAKAPLAGEGIGAKPTPETFGEILFFVPVPSTS